MKVTMCCSRRRITNAVCALCYILTGFVIALAISMATQGELMACVILTAFAGLLIWYAQDEKKTANTGGMEDLEMDDLERARELLHYLATTKSAGKNALAYREKLDEFLRLIYQDMPMGEEVEAQRHVQA